MNEWVKVLTKKPIMHLWKIERMNLLLKHLLNELMINIMGLDLLINSLKNENMA